MNLAYGIENIRGPRRSGPNASPEKIVDCGPKEFYCGIRGSERFTELLYLINKRDWLSLLEIMEYANMEMFQVLLHLMLVFSDAWIAWKLCLGQRKRIKALEVVKLQKEATCRCKNCLTACKDQNPDRADCICNKIYTEVIWRRTTIIGDYCNEPVGAPQSLWGDEGYGAIAAVSYNRSM
ncbi:hypothetical protein SUGI_0691180 [Cryptomeria japonica]|nr:hypothetical protein SUGI_0691180 [Cryptomeria japonica]